MLSMMRLEGFSFLTVFLMTGVNSLFIGNTIYETYKQHPINAYRVRIIVSEKKNIFVCRNRLGIRHPPSLLENEIDRQDQQAETD